MKKIYTALAIGAISSLQFANTMSVNAFENPLPHSAIIQKEAKVFFVDKKDNGDIGYSRSIEKGSRVYGYLYHIDDITSEFRIKIPEGMCITGEGLPTVLPHLTHHKDEIIKNNNHSIETNITAETIIADTKSNNHIDLNPIINDSDQSNHNSDTVFKDGSRIYFFNNKSPFYYSTDNGTTWIKYRNRNDAHIPNDCSITDFKIENTGIQYTDAGTYWYGTPSIFTYNMKVIADNVNSFNPGTADKLEEDVDGVRKIISGEQPSVSYSKNNIAPKCESLPINISIEKKEKEKENPVLPSAPPNSSGPGGYIPVEPTKTEIIKPITNTETTNPIIVNKCQNIVKNLDDKKLLEYYKKLQVESGLNVHGDISRLDLIRLAVNAGYLTADENEDLTILNNFADIAKNSWYAKYVAKIIKKDILSIGELANNTKNLKLFGTNDAIKREDAVKILANIITEKNLKLPNLNEIITFSDVKNSDKNADYIQYAYNSCLLHGRKTLDGNPIDGKNRVFEWYSNITVAETAKILYNGQDIRK